MAAAGGTITLFLQETPELIVCRERCKKLNSGYYESNLLRDIDFVYEEGKGLEWLKSQGMNTILSIAEENYSVLKPTAVIFNLGVNDPGNMYDYISY